MKRICIVIGSLVQGGAERQSVQLAEALSCTHEILFVTLRDVSPHPDHLQSLSKAGIEHRGLRAAPWARVPRLAKLFRSWEPEIVFSYLPGDVAVAALAGRWAGVPAVVGGVRNSKIGRLKWNVLRFLHNHLLTLSVSNSFAGREACVARGFRDDRFVVIPNGIEPIGEAHEKRDDDTLRVLSVGRFVEQKDYRTAIRAFAKFRERIAPSQKAVYTIAGVGPMEDQLRAWISEAGLSHEIELEIDPPHLEDLYRRSDLYLCSSLFEGLSNTVMEAMNHGLPVVATDAGDNGQLVLEGRSGLLAPIGDVDRIAEALVALAEDGERRVAMGREAQRRIQDAYALPVFQRQYLELVEKLS